MQNKKNFKKETPSKYWFISINNAFYTNDSKNPMSPLKDKAYRFFDETKAKNVFDELNRRYSVVNAVVKLNFFEKQKPKETPKDTVETVIKKHHQIKTAS